MRAVVLVILVAFILSVASLAYSLGVRKGLAVYEFSVRNGVAERYIERFGSPKTKEEQCKFDYIVYGDVSECNQ